LQRTLFLQLLAEQVEMAIKGQSAHNHVCGCTKCWKPKGALFSAGRRRNARKPRRQGERNKLAIVDPKATIQPLCLQGVRGPHVCRIENRAIRCYGFDFISHRALNEAGWSPPEFAPSFRRSSNRARAPTTWARSGRG